MPVHVCAAVDVDVVLASEAEAQIGADSEI